MVRLVPGKGASPKPLQVETELSAEHDAFWCCTTSSALRTEGGDGRINEIIMADNNKLSNYTR